MKDLLRNKINEISNKFSSDISDSIDAFFEENKNLDDKRLTVEAKYFKKSL